MSVIKNPFGVSEVVELEDAATIDLTITNTKTLLKRAGGISQAMTINLTADRELLDRSQVIIDIEQSEDEFDVDFGTDGNTIVAPTLTGSWNDRDVIILEYDKAEDKFIAVSAWQKITDETEPGP